MSFHYWGSSNDFEYCTLTNCKYDSATNSIVLDNSLSGTILSDIRDSTKRLIKYDEIIPKTNIPAGTTAKFYVRTGVYHKYDELYPELWTDWKDITQIVKIVEYTLSLTNKKILVDYDIAEIVNIYYSTDIRFLQLATHLTTAFINSLDENDPTAAEQYLMLWSAIVDTAICGFAKTDYDPGTASRYAEQATFVDNVIRLKNTLPLQNVPVVIEYFPRFYSFVVNNYQYFQWKCELTSDTLGISPSIREFSAYYTLDYQKEIQNEFPMFFRRL